MEVLCDAHANRCTTLLARCHAAHSPAANLASTTPSTLVSTTPAGDYSLEVCDDVHAVAGLLKLYLRELPEPLLTHRFYDTFIAVQSMSRTEPLSACLASCVSSR